MTLKCTAGYSPWSNGILERANAVLTEMLLKVREDTSVSWEIALSWAVLAKNSLISVNGFSKHQLVFGNNPNLPSVSNNTIAGNCTDSTSHYVTAHLQALHAARRAFIASESSERLKRALRTNTRNCGREFETGQSVFYLRNNQWRGPGVVIGQESVVVIITHGGAVIRAHSSRVQAKDQKMNKENDQDENGTLTKTSDDANQIVPDCNSDSESVHEITPSVKQEDLATMEQLVVPNSTELGTEDMATTEQVVVPNSTELRPEVAIRNSSVQKAKDIAKLPRGTLLSFKIGADIVSGSIKKRAAKATGQYNTWYNIEKFSDDPDSSNVVTVDLKQVQDLEIRQPETSEIVFLSDNCFEDAKIQELNNWNRLKVFDEVDFIGQSTISCR